MEPEPTVFLCPSCKCKLTAGKTTSVLTCPQCGKEVDVAVLRNCVAETWKALEQSAEQLQSWRSAKDLEEQFVFYTAQYAKLLDLVSHPVDSSTRQSNTFGRLKDEPEATRATFTK